jgi:hypothetical protein
MKYYKGDIIEVLVDDSTDNMGYNINCGVPYAYKGDRFIVVSDSGKDVTLDASHRAYDRSGRFSAFNSKYKIDKSKTFLYHRPTINKIKCIFNP